MDGPLIDDWMIGVTLSPPHYSGAGPTLVIRWTEPGPMPDQRRVYTFDGRLSAPAIARLTHELLVAYLVSRASGIRRVISQLERAGELLL